MCWADELLFVSVGNRFANKHLHVSINLTYKYELNLSLLAGYVGVELYSLLSNVLTNTTNFGGGTIPLTSPLQLLGGVSLPSPGIVAHGSYFVIWQWFLPLIKRGLCRHAVSVCPSVTFVSCIKTNKHIIKIFSPSGSPTILVFPYQTASHYSDGNSPNGGLECRWGRPKSRFLTNIWLCDQ